MRQAFYQPKRATTSTGKSILLRTLESSLQYEIHYNLQLQDYRITGLQDYEQHKALPLPRRHHAHSYVYKLLEPECHTLTAFAAPVHVATMVAFVGNPNLPALVHYIRHDAIETLSGIATTNSIQLVAIIGGYLLLRPRFIRLVGQHQASQLHQTPQGAPIPNISHVADSQGYEDEDPDQGQDVGWGGRARRRQLHGMNSSGEDDCRAKRSSDSYNGGPEDR